MNFDLLRIVCAVAMVVGAGGMYVASRYQKPGALRAAYTGFCVCIFVAACFEGSLGAQRALPESAQYALDIVFAVASVGTLVFGIRVAIAQRKETELLRK